MASASDTSRIEPRETAPRRIADRGDEAPPDRVGRFDRNLLADDRARQSRERVAAALQVDVRVGTYEPPQYAVAAAERCRRLVPVSRLHRRGADGGRLWE